MALDVSTLASQMLGAALPFLKQGGSDIEDFAKEEFTKIAQQIVAIGENVGAGQLDEPRAKLLLDMQKNASATVLQSVKGLALVTAEQAINAALGVVRTAVNTAIGIALL
jgi:hypothetical protein